MAALTLSADDLADLTDRLAPELFARLAELARPARNLTREEAAERLGVGLTTLKGLVRDGALGANRVGGQVFVSEAEVARFIERAEAAERRRVAATQREAAVTELRRRKSA